TSTSPAGDRALAGSRGGTTASATRATSGCASTSSPPTPRSRNASPPRGSTTPSAAANARPTTPRSSPTSTATTRPRHHHSLHRPGEGIARHGAQFPHQFAGGGRSGAESGGIGRDLRRLHHGPHGVARP